MELRVLTLLNKIFSDTFFRRTGIFACSSVFLLFLLGGLVRVTGSGMGCPDWPKCFGLLAPPTCDCQLPADYQKTFLEKRIKKLERFTATLSALGFTEKAKAIQEDPRMYVPEEFNVFKAWTEYINRLFGVLAGLLGLAFALLSIRRRKEKPAITIYAMLALFMLILNAGLGSIVVATNLLSGIVTLHFLLSFLCMFFFMLALHKHKAFRFKGDDRALKREWVAMFIVSLIIVIYGTFAREKVEILSADGMLKSGNMLDLSAMGIDFAIHRFLPGALFVYTLWLWWKNKNTLISQARFSLLTAFLIFDQIALGAVNTVYSIPAFSQVGHIVLGALLPVVLFYAVIAKPDTKTD